MKHSRTTGTEYDAVVIGSGPNGLSAAVKLAMEGLQVLVVEAKNTIGGGTRTLELTEPGFLHDICSAVHPTAAGSPFFKTLPLEDYGLEWIHPDIPYSHPMDDEHSVHVYRSLERTAAGLRDDSRAYSKLYKPIADNWDALSEDIFGTLRIPSNPLSMARFGLYGMLSARRLSDLLFKNSRTKAMFGGAAAHSILPLTNAFSASFGLVLNSSAHAVGWPVAKGGSAAITSALADYFKSLGGKIQTALTVSSLSDIPTAKSVFFDLTPWQIASILENELPASYWSKLLQYRYGPGVYKMDYALSEPVPWKDPELLKSGTLHLGSSFEELAVSEKEVWEGKHPDKPYVLLSQPSLFDHSRAPEGKHTLWAYCHVPNGSERDMTNEIEDQIERYAPGFRDTVISRHGMSSMEFEVYNPNYIGGDINGGAQMLKQLFGRPVLKWNPYKIPLKGMYICSSSTPPGGGVHGMCGYHSAVSALKTEFGIN